MAVPGVAQPPGRQNGSTCSRPAFVHALSHLDGPLHLSCESGSSLQYALHIRSSSSGRIRSLIGLQPEQSASPERAAFFPRCVLNSPLVAPRVRSLDIAVSLWRYLVPYMVEFEAVSCVAIVLDTAAGLAPLWKDTRAIVCPVLRTLCLSSLLERRGSTRTTS
ncbi:hypothetical protein AURDEDRAFT_172747 [Auricularia subglabra TFB-10046 SS5]|nr:hypothetical protein AURDEDRAFT_172747 [Auricularia subglabra TFB-10046 SS5]